MQAANLDLDGTVKPFIYGEPGSGKTTFVATAMDDPRTRPLLHINCGGQPKSMRRRSVDERPTIIEMTELKDMMYVYDFFANGQKDTDPLRKKCSEAGIKMYPHYNSLSFDGFTQVQRIAVGEIVGFNSKKPGEALPRAEIQHWGDALNRMVYATNLFYMLPVSVIVTSLDKLDKDELRGSIEYGPWLWGQARNELPAYSLLTMRMVRQANVQTTIRKELTPDAYSVAYVDQFGTQKYLAKDQYGMQDKDGKRIAFLENPTIPMIMDLIYGPYKA